MFAKIAVLCVVVAVAIARPDKPQRGYNYQAPARSFSPRQTYQAPESIEDTYAAPSSPEVSYSSPESSEEYGPLMPFDFGYIVDDEETDASFGHTSNSDGKQVTGQYRVVLPDCRTQIVTYTADRENGFNAEVTYEGEPCPYVPPQRDDSYEAPQSGYSAPN